MSKTFTITGQLTVADANQGPVFTEQPPTSPPVFVNGTPARIAYGQVVDPDGDPLVVNLEPAVSGFSLSLQGTQIWLDFNGNGVAGQYAVQVSADDGK